MFSPLLLLLCYQSQAQTESDGIMMNKKQFCNGVTYMYSTWDQYWEGTLKRKNEEILLIAILERRTVSSGAIGALLVTTAK